MLKLNESLSNLFQVKTVKTETVTCEANKTTQIDAYCDIPDGYVWFDTYQVYPSNSHISIQYVSSSGFGTNQLKIIVIVRNHHTSDINVTATITVRFIKKIS